MNFDGFVELALRFRADLADLFDLFDCFERAESRELALLCGWLVLLSERKESPIALVVLFLAVAFLCFF